MSERFVAEEEQLCEQFATAARGPKRNGLFAVWLLLRVAGDRFAPHPVSERAHRRRSEALVKRLTSLTLPGELRVPLRDAARAVGDQPRSNVSRILSGLVSPVRETLGNRAAGAVSAAATLASQPDTF